MPGAVNVRGPARYGLAAGIVVAVALALYVPTLLPDVGTWDTAEFQAIGPVLGIAHPTGYPSYTLLAWLASVVLQPFGNEAYRADLLSALLVAGAAGLLAIRTVQATARWPLGVLAGVAFAVTPIAWRLSTRADAHALHAFLAALILVLLAAWQQRAQDGDRTADRWLLATAVAYGVALGNHALTLLLAPGMAAYVLLVSPRILRRRWRLVLACLATAVMTSAALYAYLPLRSLADPPLDYADPETWRAFWYLVLGQQFEGSFGGLPPLADAVAGAWDELVRDYGGLAILVPAGVILGAIRHPRLVVLTVLWFAATWLFALAYANAVIERYYVVPGLVAALWLALAVDVVWDVLRDLIRSPTARLGPTEGPAREGAAGLIPALLVVALLATASASVPERRSHVDASDETFGRDWLEASLAALEPDAVVVSWWSFSTPLWYGRWVEGRREDIVIVDDRDVIDEGFGNAEAAIDHYLDERPVYIIRREQDLPALARRYRLERVAQVPSPGDMYRVLSRVAD